MPTTTISLERSAYDLLKARKKPDESFSEELHRLLGSASPDLKGFLDLVSPMDGRVIADSIESIRAQDLEEARKNSSQRGKKHGHRT
jgi:predicted CopG family antitoxin